MRLYGVSDRQMSTECRRDDVDREKAKYSRKNLSQCQEPCPPQTSDRLASD